MWAIRGLACADGVVFKTNLNTSTQERDVDNDAKELPTAVTENSPHELP